MSDILAEKFKETFESEYPPILHSRIVAGINFWRWRKVFYSVFFLLFANLFIAGLFFIRRFIDNDALVFIKFMVREFEVTQSYFYQFAGVLYDTIPLGLFLTLIINIILIVYITKIYFWFKKDGGRLFLGHGVIKN